MKEQNSRFWFKCQKLSKMVLYWLKILKGHLPHLFRPMSRVTRLILTSFSILSQIMAKHANGQFRHRCKNIKNTVDFVYKDTCEIISDSPQLSLPIFEKIIFLQKKHKDHFSAPKPIFWVLMCVSPAIANTISVNRTKVTPWQSKAVSTLLKTQKKIIRFYY